MKKLATKLAVLPFLLLILMGMNLYGQENRAIDTSKAISAVSAVEIKTSAMCMSCKKNIESTVNKLKGIKSASLDLDTKILKVKYKTALIEPDDIRRAVAKAGYDADEFKAVKSEK